MGENEGDGLDKGDVDVLGRGYSDGGTYVLFQLLGLLWGGSSKK